MTDSSIVVVTGANGLVGSRTCAALIQRGATVRAVVRRPGTAPDGTEEHVGDFADPGVAASAVAGASAVVTTVHPMGSDRATQHRVAVEGTPVIARAARDAGADLLVHVSTAGVYDRSPGVGDVDESAPLVADDAGAYAVTKRDTDAALGQIDGLTRVLVRPPAILGPGETSVWNALRPAGMRDDESQRHAVPDKTFAWIHVDDLATLIADVATGRIATSDVGTGPVAGSCTVVNAAAGPATQRDYVGAVTAALGLEPVWDDEPAWTGQILATRARGWGWTPAVDLDAALSEIASGLRPAHDRIDLEIEVRAALDAVWDQVCVPGWFVNDGTLVDNEVTWNGDRAHVASPSHGSFTFLVEERDDPPHLRERAGSAADVRTVELFATEESPGLVRLRVVESGFAAMDVPPEQQVAEHEENTETWQLQLRLVKERLES